MARYLTYIIAIIVLTVSSSICLGQTTADTTKSDTGEAKTLAPRPKQYFLPEDSLGEPGKPRESFEVPVSEEYREALESLEELDGWDSEKSKAALEEARKKLEELGQETAVPPLPPKPGEQVILPDTVYTTEIAIDQNGITYYDTLGEKNEIIGEPVPLDEPFVISGEGTQVITTSSTGDIVQIGSDVIIDQDERVNGSVISIGGNVVVRGEVKGDAVAVLGTVTVDGYVHGDVVSPTGTVTISSTGRVRRNVVASAIITNPGARIGGSREYTGVNLPFGGDVFHGFYVSFMMLQLGIAVFAVFLVLLGHAFAGKNIAVVRTRIMLSSIKSFFVGLVTMLLGIPILWLLLIITVIGIPVAFLVLPLAVAVAVVLGYSAVGLRLGEKLVENNRIAVESQLGRTLVGVSIMLLLTVFGAVLLLAQFAPTSVLGWILFGVGIAVSFIATTAGLGAVVLTRFGTRLEKPRPPAAAGTPATLPTEPIGPGSASG